MGCDLFFTSRTLSLREAGRDILSSKIWDAALLVGSLSLREAGRYVLSYKISGTLPLVPCW